MAGTAEKTDPKLWDRVKKEVAGGGKGGRKGQWSARKAQLASAEYKKEGGGYKGAKAADNHLSQWTKEEWGTKSGGASRTTGERYLPRKARAKLSDEEYGRSTAAKRRDTAKGKQFSRQPADVAKKAAGARKTGTPSATTVKRRSPAEAPRERTPATKTAAPRAAAGKATARKQPTAADAPARKKAAAVREAAPVKPAARKPATRTPARKATARKPAAGGGGTAHKTGAAPRKAAPGAVRKSSASRKPMAKRRASPVRSTKGGSKR